MNLITLMVIGLFRLFHFRWVLLLYGFWGIAPFFPKFLNLWGLSCLEYSFIFFLMAVGFVMILLISLLILVIYVHLFICVILSFINFIDFFFMNQHFELIFSIFFLLLISWISILYYFLLITLRLFCSSLS